MPLNFHISHDRYSPFLNLGFFKKFKLKKEKGHYIFDLRRKGYGQLSCHNSSWKYPTLLWLHFQDLLDRDQWCFVTQLMNLYKHGCLWKTKARGFHYHYCFVQWPWYSRSQIASLAHRIQNPDVRKEVCSVDPRRVVSKVGLGGFFAPCNPK